MIRTLLSLQKTGLVECCRDPPLKADDRWFVLDANPDYSSMGSTGRKVPRFEQLKSERLLIGDCLRQRSIEQAYRCLFDFSQECEGDVIRLSRHPLCGR